MKTLKPISTNQAIYLAGLFDGEGSVVIYARKTYPSSKSKTMPHRMQVTITNTHQGVMEWLYDTFGGNLWSYKKRSPSKPNQSKAWKWVAQCREAEHILKAMLPYLIVKKEQALIALELQSDISAYKKTVRGPGRGRIGIPALPQDRIEYRERLRVKLLEVRQSELHKFP